MSKKLSKVVQLAKQIAIAAHANQFRHDGVTNYITHPAAVAKKLSGESDEVIATAWLHDVLENSEYTTQTLISAGVPVEVVAAIEILTFFPSIEEYHDYLNNIRMNKIAVKVKIADMLHNLGDTPTKKQIIKYAEGLLLLLS